MADERIIDGLNPQQCEAVTTTEGPLLVLAGAGSGKTSVLTRRIAWILDSGLAHRHQILGVTFTNKAAGEMTERIAQLCGMGFFPNVGTFHSVCARWLRREAEAIGISASFSIYDTQAQTVVIKAVLKELNLDDKKYPPRRILSDISRCKNDGQLGSDLRLMGDEYHKKLAECMQLYNDKLMANKALDFDDILCFTVKMLREHEDIRAKYRHRFRYILVDEFQDVNPVQYELLRLLLDDHHNFCVVGDDDQSIYGFRGADLSIILRFEKDFTDAKVIKLEQNYRSIQGVLDVANNLVAHNQGRMGKKLWSSRTEGMKPVFYVADSGDFEANYVVKEISQLLLSGYTYADIAVIYRTNAQSRPFEERMIRRGMAYDLIGGHRFYERREIKDILAFLSLAANADDVVALERACTSLAGIGTGSFAKLVSFASLTGKPIGEILQNSRLTGVQERIALKFDSLFEWLDRTRTASRGSFCSVRKLTESALEFSDYREQVRRLDEADAEARLENLDELINVVQQFDENIINGVIEPEEGATTLETFLHSVSLLSDQDSVNDQNNKITLMTIHTSKGLEYPVVFLVGLEEGALPHFRALESDNSLKDVEEERRLCYVGMTRAKDRLYVTAALNRYLNGAYMDRTVSRFITEVPPEYFSFHFSGSPGNLSERTARALRDGRLNKSAQLSGASVREFTESTPARQAKVSSYKPASRFRMPQPLGNSASSATPKVRIVGESLSPTRRAIRERQAQEASGSENSSALNASAARQVGAETSPVRKPVKMPEIRHIPGLAERQAEREENNRRRRLANLQPGCIVMNLHLGYGVVRDCSTAAVKVYFFEQKSLESVDVTALSRVVTPSTLKMLKSKYDLGSPETTEQ